MTYRELYSILENPLDNRKNFDKFIEKVIESKNEYRSLTSNDPQEETRVNVADRDEFYKISRKFKS